MLFYAFLFINLSLEVLFLSTLRYEDAQLFSGSGESSIVHDLQVDVNVVGRQKDWIVRMWIRCEIQIIAKIGKWIMKY